VVELMKVLKMPTQCVAFEIAATLQIRDTKSPVGRFGEQVYGHAARR